MENSPIPWSSFFQPSAVSFTAFNEILSCHPYWPTGCSENSKGRGEFSKLFYLQSALIFYLSLTFQFFCWKAHQAIDFILALSCQRLVHTDYWSAGYWEFAWGGELKFPSREWEKGHEGPWGHNVLIETIGESGKQSNSAQMPPKQSNSANSSNSVSSAHTLKAPPSLQMPLKRQTASAPMKLSTNLLEKYSEVWSLNLALSIWTKFY